MLMPRHAVAQLQERTAGRAAAAHVEEGVAQRTVDASADVGRVQAVEGEDVAHQRIRRHARQGGVAAGFTELLHQDRERGGVELDRGGQQRLARGACVR